MCLGLLQAFLAMACSENICLQRIYDLINDQNMPAGPRPVQTLYEQWSLSSHMALLYQGCYHHFYTVCIDLYNTSHCIHIVCSCLSSSVRAEKPAVLPFSLYVPRHRYVSLGVIRCLTL